MKTRRIRLWHMWRIGLPVLGLMLAAWWLSVPGPVLSQDDGTRIISVESDGQLAVPGQTVQYQIRILNWKDQPLSNAVITHTLPPGFSYVPGSSQFKVSGGQLQATDPISVGQTMSWGGLPVPAAGQTARNPYGVHTFVQDLCVPAFVDWQLDRALEMVGGGGYVTQTFYPITAKTTGPDPCAVYFVNAAYDRNLTPIIRLQGKFSPHGYWVKPDPGPDGSYRDVAKAFARYVEGLPRRDMYPILVTIWNEPDLWVEWSGVPNAEEYGRFFVAVSRAIHRLNDPRIVVLNGAVTPANTRFIREMLEVPGFVDAFDVWASHCYPYNHPPSYNLHSGTAGYGEAAIDCYLLERSAIIKYGGRDDFQFVVKETGHRLGDGQYHFEGYPVINESNRAAYMSSAFEDYWRSWPELIAVTPYQLGDPWSGWEDLDWIDLTFSPDLLDLEAVPHLQYTQVSDLEKKRGNVVPRGVELRFTAAISPDLPLAEYSSILTATVKGDRAVDREAAPVNLVEKIEQLYLPTVWAQTDRDWQDQQPAVGQIPLLTINDAGVELGGGAIVPTHFLGANGAGQEDTGPGVTRFALDEETQAWTVDGRLWSPAGRALLDPDTGSSWLIPPDGRLLEVKAGSRQATASPDLPGAAVDLAAGPEPGQLYLALDSGQVILYDPAKQQVLSLSQATIRPRGLAFDPLTGSLLVADVGAGEVVRFSPDLSSRLEAVPLPDLPDQLLLDPERRRLYLTLPGPGRLLALDADSLALKAEYDLPGGPLVEAVLDAGLDRLYLLSVLAPRRMGITVLDAGSLTRQAMLAGSLDYPLTRADGLALTPDGRLLTAEGDRLYLISPHDFGVLRLE